MRKINKKSLITWIVLILIGLSAGKIITYYYYEYSQTNRIIMLQRDFVENLYNDTLTEQLRQDFITLTTNAKNPAKCSDAIQNEIAELKETVNTIDNLSLPQSHIKREEIIRRHIEILKMECR